MICRVLLKAAVSMGLVGWWTSGNLEGQVSELKDY
jgi:hypothetical protein